MVRYLFGYYVGIIYEEGVLRDPNSFYIYFIFMHYCVYMIWMCGTTGTDVLYIDYRCTDNLLDSFVKRFFPYYFLFHISFEKLLPSFFSNSCRVSIFTVVNSYLYNLINVKRYSSDWITTLMK